jgi:hypothetical protein
MCVLRDGTGQYSDWSSGFFRWWNRIRPMKLIEASAGSLAGAWAGLCNYGQIGRALALARQKALVQRAYGSDLDL